MTGQSSELHATVAYVGAAGAGTLANLRGLTRYVVPEPVVVESSHSLRLTLVLATPWSGERLRLDLEAWDAVPVDPEAAARLAAASVIVFVADAHPARLTDDVEALALLERTLAAHGARLADVPHVMQYNQHNDRCVTPLRELREALNAHGADETDAAAALGRGVLTTLVLALHAMSPRRSRHPPAPG